MTMQALKAFRGKLINETDEGKKVMLTKIISEGEEAEKRLDAAIHDTNSSSDDVKDAQKVLLCNGYL